MLKRDTDPSGRMQDAAAIDVQPQAHMDRVTRLAHQDRIALAGLGHEAPTPALGMVPEGIEHPAQVGRIDRDLGHLDAEVLPPAEPDQPPTIQRLCAAPACLPRPADQLFRPVHGIIA